MKDRRKGMRNLKFFLRFAIVVVVALAVAVIYVLQTELPPYAPLKTQLPERKKLPGRKETAVRQLPGGKETAEDLSRETRRVAIIVDDIGNDLASVDELLALDVPITFAILPHCAHSVDAARVLHRAGREVLLHLPMEPHGYPEQKPGAGAVFVSMTDEEIMRRVDEDLASVPHAVGINNHMGSRFMEDEAKLAVVLKQIKARGLFFVDSRTTRYTRGEEIAARLGLAFVSRQVFIDSGRTYEEARRSLMGAGDGSGPVLMIGHPYPGTIRALREVLPVLKNRGVEVVSVSKLTAPAGEKRP